MLVAAAVGALISAGATYAIVQDKPTSPPAEELQDEAPARPPAELVDSEHGFELCRSAAERVGGPGSEVVAAFDTTAGAYAAAAAPAGREVSRPSGLTAFAESRLAEGPETPLFVCYIDPAEPMAIRAESPHRVRALVDGYGGAFAEVMGNRAEIEVIRPGEPSYWP